MDRDSKKTARTERERSLAQRSRSLTRGTERQVEPVPSISDPALSEVSQTTHHTAQTPQAASRSTYSVTPHRSQPAPEHTISHTATKKKAQPVLPLVKRPTGSPKSDLESDYIIVSRLVKADLLSGDLARVIAMSLNDRQQLLDDTGAKTPDEKEMEDVCNYAALTPLPQTAPSAPLKRQRTEADLLHQDATNVKMQRVAADAPLPQRDPRTRRTAPTPRVVEMETSQPPPPPATSDDQRPSTSFADAARTPHRPADAAPPGQNQGPRSPATGLGATTSPATTRKPKYPPLIVESLPNWASHLRQLKAKLGRTPNARPFGKGIKFTPADDQEYRQIQRYLSELEKAEKISWFSYSLPQDRSLKVAIRGVPVKTDPEEIAEDFRTLGFEPEVVRPIKARKGRPGCIFFAIFKRTPDLVPAIYGVTELLCMPGVHIEAWRGKKGPAQCHRCQGFRHSSHNCHRKQACVRCGGEHSAHDCPRPREEPATCANCGGPHPSNNLSCPVFRREARNKRAGTVATTVDSRREGSRSRPQTQTQAQTRDQSAAQEITGSSNLRPKANDPTPRGAKPKGKRKPRKAGGPTQRDQTPAAPTTTTQQGQSQRPKDRQSLMETAISILSDVLLALRAGEDPIDVVLRGMSSLIKLNG